MNVDILQKVQQYYTLSKEAKTIKSKMDELAKEIKLFASDNGVKDDSGSSYCSGNGFTFGQTAKKKVSFDEEKAISFFKSHGFSSCVHTVEVIDEDAVGELISTGDITVDDLSSITKTSITYSISVKKNKEPEEVQKKTIESAFKRRRLKGVKK